MQNEYLEINGLLSNFIVGVIDLNLKCLSQLLLQYDQSGGMGRILTISRLFWMVLSHSRAWTSLCSQFCWIKIPSCLFTDSGGKWVSLMSAGFNFVVNFFPCKILE